MPFCMCMCVCMRVCICACVCECTHVSVRQRVVLLIPICVFICGHCRLQQRRAFLNLGLNSKSQVHYGGICTVISRCIVVVPAHKSPDMVASSCSAHPGTQGTTTHWRLGSTEKCTTHCPATGHSCRHTLAHTLACTQTCSMSQQKWHDM